MEGLRIIGVEVFLEKRKTRTHVGHLKKVRDKFVFTYDENYFRARNAISFGPEFPLTQRIFESKRLFPTFEDRIPSQQNPAYSEYCLAMGIDPTEQNPLILLSTIGKKGPSSFIFYPIFETEITADDIKKFRNSLNLTTREFAKVFELSQSSLSSIEKNRSTGKDLLKRLGLILKFPSVALHYLNINGGALAQNKQINALNVLKKATNETSFFSS